MMERLFLNDKIQVIKHGEYLHLHYLKPHSIIIQESDKQGIDNEIIRMLKIRDESNKKYFIQKAIGQIIGVSRQMVNRRWQVYKREGLVSLLSGEWERSKMTPAIIDRITELCVENPYISAGKIKEILESEGLCERISEGTIYNAQKEMDGRKVIEYMREKSSRANPGIFLDSGYMINMLFQIIDKLFDMIPVELQEDTKEEKRLFDYLRTYFKGGNPYIKGPGERDSYKPRKKLDRDRKRNIGFIERLLTGITLFKKCPDCHSANTKFHFNRERYYLNSKGERVTSYSTVYRCQNSDCRTKYFTQPPHGVELYARVHTKIKKMVLRWTFHLRSCFPQYYFT